MKLQALVISASLALSLIGCKSSNEAQVEKMVSMMEDMGNVVDKAGDDCGKMADGLEAITKKYDLEAMKSAAEKLKGDKDEAKKIMEKYGDRMTKVMPKMMGMMKCSEDPKMKALESKLKGVM
ncbi:MAG: hypothetical protein HOV81_15160 [Kofleriaceae bacterium]|nr:hypothetical protein [Kofleriaceae bacterium]